MYKRDIQPIVEEFKKIFPIIGITGPRQSGKTTLAKLVFPQLDYVSLENIDTRILAKEDPRKFLSKFENGAIIDEVQHVPDLLSYLQTIVDSSDQKGRFVLTGSQNFALNEHINQSLAGRIGMINLQPLSMNELSMPDDLQDCVFKGGYPGLHKMKANPVNFYPSYIQTFIERDVRQFKNIENFDRFRIFIKLCAGRTGQIINYSSLAQDCGISPKTAREWLNVLQANYIVFLLHPFHRNFSKRLIKMPKLYFYDTGLACSLLSIENSSQIESHYLKGSLFENLIILEVLKKRINQGLLENLYFWRDRTGREIDLIGEWGGKIHAMEIKMNSTFNPSMLKQLNYFSGLCKEALSYLIFTGDESDGQEFKDVQLVPVKKMNKII